MHMALMRFVAEAVTKLASRSPISGALFIIQRAPISTTPRLFVGEYEWQDPKSEDEVVNITYITKEGRPIRVRGKVGDNLMFLAHRFDVEMEGCFCVASIEMERACEASLACTTCHVYVKDEYLSKLTPPVEEEEDLLDLAPFLKSNSRLGCQIILNKSLEGLEVTLPPATRNFYVDGKAPAKH